MAGKKARGKRAKTRAKITAHRIRPTVTRLLHEFKEGDTVQVVIEGAVQAGMPFRRFHGLTGKVIGLQGRAAKVRLRQGNQWCTVITNPIHLKAIEQTAAGTSE